MIRNESDYQQALTRLREEKHRLEEQRQCLENMGLSEEEVERGMEPLVSFHLQLEEEVEGYEKLKRGDLGDVMNLQGFGRLLVAARIARGWTQRELAQKMNVHESQVSRDERNEYHGITLERASKILDVLGVELRSEFVSPVLPEHPAL